LSECNWNAKRKLYLVYQNRVMRRDRYKHLKTATERRWMLKLPRLRFLRIKSDLFLLDNFRKKLKIAEGEIHENLNLFLNFHLQIRYSRRSVS